MSNLIPDGWAEVVLGDYAHIKARIGWRGLSSSEYTETGPYLIAGTHIKGESVDWNNCHHINQFRYDESPEIQLQERDVIISKDGTIGRLGFIEKMPGPATINGTMMLVRPNSNFNSKFIYYYLQGDKFQTVVKEKVSGSSVPHIFQRDMVTLKVPLPPLPEQQKIAAILTSADDVIEKTQAQIDKLKDLKTGMMQELLTRGVGVDGKPHTEFKDSPVGRIPKEWDVLQISALCSHIVDCVNKTAQVVDYKTPYKMIRTTNVRHGRVDTESVRNVTKETYEAWTRRLLPENGDLIFTREAPVGECGILEDARGIFLGQRTMMYRADEAKTSSQFLMYSLMSEYGQQQLKDFSGGSTVPHMRVPDCGKILIKTPSKKEQEIIADSLGSVDSAIKRKETKLHKVKNTKKALMQDLLTGKVRVKVDS